MTLEELATQGRTFVANYTKHRGKMLDAIIGYGKVLIDGRAMHNGNNKAFGEWIKANGLAVKPFDTTPERTCAIRIAEISVDSTKLLTECPFNTPTNIMTWWREQHPEQVQKRPAPTKPHKAPATDHAEKVLRQIAATGAALPADNKKFGKEIGVSHASVEKAKDRIHQDRAKQAPPPDPATLPEPDRKAVERVIATQEKTFQATVAKAVAEEMSQALAEWGKQIEAARAIIRQADAHGTMWPFSAEEYRRLLAALHPDQSMSAERRAEVFNMVREREDRLRVPDDPSKWGGDLPKDFGELIKARARRAAELRAKKAKREGLN